MALQKAATVEDGKDKRVAASLFFAFSLACVSTGRREFEEVRTSNITVLVVFEI